MSGETFSQLTLALQAAAAGHADAAEFVWTQIATAMAPPTAATSPPATSKDC